MDDNAPTKPCWEKKSQCMLPFSNEIGTLSILGTLFYKWDGEKPPTPN